MRREESRKSLRQWFARILDLVVPERQIVLRTEGRVSYVRLGRRVQLSIISCLFALGAWATFTSVSFFVHEYLVSVKEARHAEIVAANDLRFKRMMADKNVQIATAHRLYGSLLDEMKEYDRVYTEFTDEILDNQKTILGLFDKNSTLQSNLETVKNRLNITEDKRIKVVAERARLMRKLARTETELSAVTNRNFALSENLGSVEMDLQTAMAERDHALNEGKRMDAMIERLETRLVALQESEQEAVQRVAERTGSSISNVEKVIKMTGLRIEDLLASNAKAAASGQGGPFVAASPDGLPADDIKADLANLGSQLERWDALRDIMERMPLATPLRYYYITSRFGKRRDPINRKWAMHYGIDMGSTFKRATAYATAPGVVTQVGWKGRYGKMVEVDHGGGLKTRYGHLHKTLVKKGQKVKFNDKVGQIGNTGRSTGPHLHYEIVYKKKSIDPTKFIKAGRHVFQE